MKEIYINYLHYLKVKKLQINELEILSDTNSLNFKIESDINSSNDYSSNHNTNSTDSSVKEEINLFENNSNNSNSSDDDGDKTIISKKVINLTI